MNNTIEEVLEIQRKNLKFSVNKLADFFYGAEDLEQLKKILNKDFTIPYDFNLMNKGRVEQIKQSYRTLHLYINNLSFNTRYTILYSMLSSFYQMPGSVHIAMFIRVIEIMGTKTQKETYLKKCASMEIVGCYAQTELGHGSDVQGLQTTATYVLGKDQFIVNSPTVGSTKFWPGQLGIMCTHAMVYARMFVAGKYQGVHAFIVQIRDKDMNLLPGIQVGDIGPKIGFNTKDNGYLILKNVTIPKSNMLRGFISVSKKGIIKKKGDPKVSYATMMTIRQYLSCQSPKILGQAITIAFRYSLFRKQFLDQNSIQKPILNYQTQQDKLIPRIAEYYAMGFGGNQIRKITETNFKMVTEHGVFELMNQTHVCLCIGKAFYGDTVASGMQILRKSCGGHGFSHYSGFPSLISEYLANLTMEGQNTILYLQIGRFVLKNYKWHLTKKKKLSQSMNYLQSFDDLIQSKLDPTKTSPEFFNNDDLQKILIQNIMCMIRNVTQKLMMKAYGKSDQQVWNEEAGIQIRKLALAHSIYYTFHSFQVNLQRQSDLTIKQILIDMCSLFGVQMFLTSCNQIIGQGLITPLQVSALRDWKQVLIRKLRPHLLGLVEAFSLPQKFIRSALARGNPYENYLQLSRKNEMNHTVLEAGKLISKQIKKVIAINPKPKF